MSRKQTTAAGAELNLLQHSALTYFDRPEDILCHSLLGIVHSNRAYCNDLRICALCHNPFKGGFSLGLTPKKFKSPATFLFHFDKNFSLETHGKLI